MFKLTRFFLFFIVDTLKDPYKIYFQENFDRILSIHMHYLM